MKTAVHFPFVLFLACCCLWSACGPNYDGFTEHVVEENYRDDPPHHFSVHLPSTMIEGRSMDAKLTPNILYFTEPSKGYHFVIRANPLFQTDWLKNTEEHFGQTSTELIVNEGLQELGWDLAEPEIIPLDPLPHCPENSYYAQMRGPHHIITRYVYTYKLACVESPGYFYQVLAWASKTEDPQFDADMDQAIRSFRILNE